REDDLLVQRRTAATVYLRPVDADVSRSSELLLPCTLEHAPRVLVVGHRLRRDVRGEPGPQLRAKCLLLGRVRTLEHELEELARNAKPEQPRVSRARARGSRYAHDGGGSSSRATPSAPRRSGRFA